MIRPALHRLAEKSIDHVFYHKAREADKQARIIPDSVFRYQILRGDLEFA